MPKCCAYVKKGAALQWSLPWQPHNLIFLRQAKIGQQGSKEHFGTCRSFLHDGRIKILIEAPFSISAAPLYHSSS